MIAALGDEEVPEEALRERLGDPWADGQVGHDDLDRLLQFDTAFSDLSGGLVYLPSFLEGTAWTVWVDPDEGAEGFVRMYPALAAIGWCLVGHDVELLDSTGARLGVLETDGWLLDGRDTDVVLGPDGWLDDLLGGWASVEVVGGSLRWTPLAMPPLPTPAQVAAMKIGFDRAVRHHAEFAQRFDAVPPPPDMRFTSGDDPIHEALLVDRRAFRNGAIPLLTDLYEAAGLVRRDSIIAEEGFDWDALRTWQTRNRLGSIYGLDAARADNAAALVAAYDMWDEADDSPDRLDATPAALDDGDVATAVWSELQQRDASAERTGAFAAALMANDPSSIGAVWLRAQLLDYSGDALAAIDALEAVVDAGCRHRPALVDLAALRADRGDAVGAMRLLAQGGIGRPQLDDEGKPVDRSDDELLWDEVEGFATHRPRPTARRNDPCPCGSGRKYKTCHLGRETHSLDDRAAWLYVKALRFLRQRHPHLVRPLVESIVDEFDQSDLFDGLVDGPFVPDVVLHEDGVFAEFLAARDSVLPSDEALLGAQWTLVDRAVFEILATHRSGLELRDIASGDRVTVVNTHDSGWTRPGMLLIGRPLPVGDTYRAFSGFMHVPDRHLDSVLAAVESGDSADLADALAAILAPPRLTNTDGDDLVTHTLSWRVPDPSDVGDALVAAGLRTDETNEWTWTRDSKNQANTIIAFVRLEGDELTVEVNSAERADELRGIVAAALPDAELVDVEDRPFEVPDSPVRIAGSGSVDMDDPAVRAALAEYIAEMEQRWIDESIPALGGRTPRQAADDPVGREELRRLLASFPVPADDEIGLMDPERLRAALGL